MLATHLTAGAGGVRASAWRTLHQEGAGESVVVALGGESNLLRPRLLFGRIARRGE